MNLFILVVSSIAVLFASGTGAGTIDHDKVKPIPQPEPVTVSEKAGVKFKPQLTIDLGCDTYAAVNTEGETSGDLKPAGYLGDCKISVLGSQVYGRAAWHNDIWAIMYAWYFPKGFWQSFPVRRHDWANVVVWIDNPALESPKILGLSYSKGDDRYGNIAPVPGFAINGTHPKFLRNLQILAGAPYLTYTLVGGKTQDLIMWDQLPDAAQAALNTTDFGNAEVPFIDEHFTEKLEKAWPF
ncbi:hypothetical protein PHYBOEH_008605 [Phytophthora boehmeriae]|uniref:Nep1-like protein n=1 Tax=Phytophthora boehmeriae TaxID=109152 RepID=A0A8T1VZ24_9STRA|nr:hypothetical protein PHYBOEH_008605 [Phytophthora boehmeriae]